MQRKATLNTRGPNALESSFHKWIKERGVCAACDNDGGVIMHHCMGATYKHNKTLVGHMFCIGLCQRCDDIITYGSRKTFTNKLGKQSALWYTLVNEWSEQTGHKCDFEIKKAILDSRQ